MAKDDYKWKRRAYSDPECEPDDVIFRNIEIPILDEDDKPVTITIEFNHSVAHNMLDRLYRLDFQYVSHFRKFLHDAFQKFLTDHHFSTHTGTKYSLSFDPALTVVSVAFTRTGKNRYKVGTILGFKEEGKIGVMEPFSDTQDFRVALYV